MEVCEGDNNCEFLPQSSQLIGNFLYVSTGEHLLKINTLSNSIEWSKQLSADSDDIWRFDLVGDFLFVSYKIMFTAEWPYEEYFGILKINALTGNFVATATIAPYIYS